MATSCHPRSTHTMTAAGLQGWACRDGQSPRAEGKNGDSAITLDANGIADHDDREAAVAEQAFGNPLDIVERNRID